MQKKILVVDDDELVLLALEELLRPKGYIVETVDSGQKALDLAKKESFDLVILDIVMPEVSGYEVCKKLRMLEGGEDIPIIMLTAKNSDEDREKGIEAGANLFLSKPISPEKLVELVEKALCR